MDYPHEPGRRDAGPVHDHRQRSAPPAEATRDSGHRELRGTLLPHQSVGLRLHRRRCPRWARQAPRQTGGPYRHRRHLGAVCSPPGQGVQAAVRIPAHALDDRRAQQPTDRSRVGGVARAGMADQADRELHCDEPWRFRHRGSGERRPGPTSSAGSSSKCGPGPRCRPKSSVR